MSIYIGDSTFAETSYAASGGSLTISGNLTVSGNVKSTAQPAFNATGTAGGWIYSPSFGGPGWCEIGSPMGWASNQQGAGSYGFSNSTGRYTAPVAGRYFFHASTYYYNHTNSTANYIHLLFGVNGGPSWNVGGTPYNIYGHGEVAGYSDGIVVSAVISLGVGDYVSLRPYWAGTSGSMYSNYSLFCGHLIA
jgi:hypothetical protein